MHRKTIPGGKNDTFQITWKPYYLNPDINSGSQDVLEVMNRRMGPDRMAMIISRLKHLGQQEGINFQFGGKTGNTRDAHRLIHLSSINSSSQGGEGGSEDRGTVHDRVVEKLFSLYFEENKDIRDVEVLKKVGIEAGLNAAEVTKWMESDLGGTTVDEQATQARRQLHVSGVPTFLIQDGEYRLDGAQDAQDFLEVFGKVKGGET